MRGTVLGVVARGGVRPVPRPAMDRSRAAVVGCWRFGRCFTIGAGGRLGDFVCGGRRTGTGIGIACFSRGAPLAGIGGFGVESGFELTVERRAGGDIHVVVVAPEGEVFLLVSETAHGRRLVWLEDAQVKRLGVRGIDAVLDASTTDTRDGEFDKLTHDLAPVESPCEVFSRENIRRRRQA
jgi:hypothetical protein